MTLFERICVLGISQVKLEPTQEARAHGLAEAFGPDEVEMVGARGFGPAEPTSSAGGVAVDPVRDVQEGGPLVVQACDASLCPDAGGVAINPDQP